MRVMTCLNRIGIGRLVLFLVIAVILLQVFHMFLLSQLEVNLRMKQDQHKESQTSVAMATVISIFNKIQNAHVTDTSGTYHIINNLIVPKAKVEKSGVAADITLVSQSSSNHLDDLIELAQRWAGPISVSVFTYDSDIAFAITSIAYVHICYEHVRNNVNFNLVYPIGKYSNFSHLEKLVNVNSISCDRTFSSIQKSNTENYAISGIEYPHNILRNIAIKSSGTNYVFVVDIDMIPSINLRQDFKQFAKDVLQTSQNQNAFIVPSFEIQSGKPIPQTKTELLKELEIGNVRPFYWEMCWRCQKITEYDVWRDLPSSDNLEEAYEVDWQDPWEPFYIASKEMPLYDERFKQYGFNRISQVCEMHIAGFRFVVLNNAFLVHKGFKKQDKFHPEKNEENKKNRVLFRQFKTELKIKYPNTELRC